MGNPAEDTTPVVVAKKRDTLQHPTEIETPAGQPNVTLIPIHPAKIILLRAARAYFTCFQGLLAAGMVGADRGVLPGELANLLWAIGGLSIGAAVASIVNNTTELFTALADKYPIMRA